MTCLHCNAENSLFLPFHRPVDGGRAYAQTCSSCGKIIGIRPSIATDPAVSPPDLTDDQIARLRFVKWRLTAQLAQRAS